MSETTTWKWLDYMPLLHSPDPHELVVPFVSLDMHAGQRWRGGGPCPFKRSPSWVSGMRIDIEDPQGAAYIRRRLAEVHGLDPIGGVLFRKSIDGDRWSVVDAAGKVVFVLVGRGIPADQITLALAHAAKRWLSNLTKETP